MSLIKLLNEDVLMSIINAEVNRLVAIKSDELKAELSKNYSFNDSLLNRKEVASKLKVSVRQIDNLRASGKLKDCCVGRSVRFKNSDVLLYINSLH